LRAAVDATVADLAASGVVAALPGGGLAPTPLGAIASAYYLRHATAAAFAAAFAGGAAAAPHARSTLPALARVLCDAAEFGELPVRHSEDEVNARLSADLPPAWRARAGDALDSPHVKAFLLLAARLARAPLPTADYVTDTKTCLDNVGRALNALIDVAANAGCLQAALAAMHLMQCVVMAAAPEESTLAQIQGAGGDEAVAALAAAAAAAAPAAAAAAAAAAAGGGRALRLLRRGVAAADSAPPGPAVADLFDVSDGALRAALRGAAASADDAAAALRHVLAVPRVALAAAAELLPAPAAAPAAGAAAARARVRVTLAAPAGSAAGRAITPAFAKKKEWGYWLVVGDAAARELLAVKRVTAPAPGARVAADLDVSLDAPAAAAAQLTLFLVSDTMRGIDYCYALQIDNLPPAAPPA
jgi:hypothetical protein